MPRHARNESMRGLYSLPERGETAKMLEQWCKVRGRSWGMSLVRDQFSGISKFKSVGVLDVPSRLNAGDFLRVISEGTELRSHLLTDKGVERLSAYFGKDSLLLHAARAVDIKAWHEKLLAVTEQPVSPQQLWTAAALFAGDENLSATIERAYWLLEKPGSTIQNFHHMVSKRWYEGKYDKPTAALLKQVLIQKLEKEIEGGRDPKDRERFDQILTRLDAAVDEAVARPKTDATAWGQAVVNNRKSGLDSDLPSH